MRYIGLIVMWFGLLGILLPYLFSAASTEMVVYGFLILAATIWATVTVVRKDLHLFRIANKENKE